MKMIKCLGQNLDCLGNYLSSLGLLSAVNTKWPEARGFWDGDEFVLVLSATQDELVDYLINEWRPVNYDTWWMVEGTDGKTHAMDPSVLRSARSKCLDNQLNYVDTHLTGTTRDRYNPVFGSGGNWGQRHVVSGWKKSVDLINSDLVKSREWLSATLFGLNVDLPQNISGGGTWFDSARKKFNSGGTSDDGKISPWSYVLAVEGSRFLRGGVGRKNLWIHYPRFPFTTVSSGPIDGKGKSKTLNEFWAPVWSHPASVTEIVTLFLRGLCRVDRKIIHRSAECAVAIMGLGVDFGLREFLRFSFINTTSANTVETSRKTRVIVGSDVGAEDLIRPLFQWKESKDYRIEELVMKVSAQPNDPSSWRHLLATVFDKFFHESKKRGYKTPEIPFGWWDKCYPVPTPTDKAILGISQTRWVRDFCLSGKWNESSAVIVDAMMRKILETEQPLYSLVRCDPTSVSGFLSSTPDLGMVPVVALLRPCPGKDIPLSSDGIPLSTDYYISAFFRPVLYKVNGTWEPSRARIVLTKLLADKWDEAVSEMLIYYRKLGFKVSPPGRPKADRLTFLASLCIPMSEKRVEEDAKYWRI